MIRIDQVLPDGAYRIVLSPNCSIRWRDLVLFYIFTCVIALAIGIFFTQQGLWFVLPFSGLEMLALGYCLYLTSRKVYRQEVITLDTDRTRVEKGVRRIDRSWEFETTWLRFVDESRGPKKRGRRLAIGSHGNYVEVGDFLDHSEKDALAFQLKDCIIRV